MKQYVPKKPVRRGFKVWVTADSSNDYFLDVDVYVGRASDGVTTEHGLGARVVLQLTKKYSHMNHRVFCDNYFSSPALFDQLLSKGLYACGTVRCDRSEYPAALRGLSLGCGEYKYQQRGQLTAVVWQDKRQVNMISMMTDANSTSTVRRKEKDGTHTTLQCPNAIIIYNKNTGGVDHGDQLRRYYTLRLKCMKNYKYIFWFLVDVSITNAFISYTQYCVHVASPESLRLKQFRLQLAEALIGDYYGRQRIGRPRTSSASCTQPIAQQLSHFPLKSGLKKRCVYCYYSRNPPCRKESRWYCGDCEGSPTLCLTGTADTSDCWRLWHSGQ